MLGQWTIPPSNLFIAGLAFVALVLLFRSRRYLKMDRPSYANPALQERPPQPASGGDIPAHYQRWETMMHQTARDLSGQLDSKMSALQSLVREAHSAAARLEAALAAAQRVPPAAEPPSPTAPPATSPAPARDSNALPAGADPRYDQIYTLADYGFDPSEIAHRVGSSRGEIELILSLRQTR